MIWEIVADGSEDEEYLRVEKGERAGAREDAKEKDEENV